MNEVNKVQAFTKSIIRHVAVNGNYFFQYALEWTPCKHQKRWKILMIIMHSIQTCFCKLNSTEVYNY